MIGNQGGHHDPRDARRGNRCRDPGTHPYRHTPDSNAMTVAPWYKVVALRREVREGRSFSPDEFAIAPWSRWSPIGEINMKEHSRLLERITARPGVFGGKPIVRDLRMSVESILSLLAQGVSQEELLDDYPELEREDILAARPTPTRWLPETPWPP